VAQVFGTGNARRTPTTRLEADMRTLIPLLLVVSPAILLAACAPTGPGPDGDFETLVLTIAPTSATIAGGGSRQFSATVVGEDGSVTSPSDVIWSSDNEAVAGVLSGGLVEGRKPGETRIVAAWKNARGSARVVVLRLPKDLPDDTPCFKSSTSEELCGTR
jgi:hypothetical protein